MGAEETGGSGEDDAHGVLGDGVGVWVHPSSAGSTVRP